MPKKKHTKDSVPEAVEAMIRKGWTTTDIAAELEVTAQSVQNWRTGTNPQPRAKKALLALVAEEIR